MFKALTSEEKAPYEEMARKDKERYKREMADYVPPSESEDESDSNKKGKGKKTTKKKKDPNAPKRGKSSFMFFSTEWRSKIKEENPDATFGELVSILATNSKCLILSSDVCTFFVIQLALNLLWPGVFNSSEYLLSLIMIIFMVVFSALYAYMTYDSLPNASMLVWPYIAWISFATLINIAYYLEFR